MADIKLFRTESGGVTELTSESVAIERSLQELFERNLDEFLGVRFLASEYSTGKTHGGRIDTLGIDDDDCPVIIEYKRSLNENVINQGLFYLDWLMDHKGEFELLVLRSLKDKAPSEIDWTNPRLLCIAADFTRYDEYAVQQIPRNISLLRYRRYGSDLLMLELVNAARNSDPVRSTTTQSTIAPTERKSNYIGFADLLPLCSPELLELWNALKTYLLSLGDDVQEKQTKYYYAFRRLKNFASVEVHPNARFITVFVRVEPASITLEDGFTRDVSQIGHYGTGDLEIKLRTSTDLERAKPLLEKSFLAS